MASVRVEDLGNVGRYEGLIRLMLNRINPRMDRRASRISRNQAHPGGRPCTRKCRPELNLCEYYQDKKWKGKTSSQSKTQTLKMVDSGKYGDVWK